MKRHLKTIRHMAIQPYRLFEKNLWNPSGDHHTLLNVGYSLTAEHFLRIGFPYHRSWLGINVYSGSYKNVYI